MDGLERMGKERKGSKGQDRNGVKGTAGERKGSIGKDWNGEYREDRRGIERNGSTGM